MPETRVRLGEALLEAGVLSQEKLEQALKIQKKRQLRLGTILLQEGFVSEPQLLQALSLHLSIPWVSLWRVDIPDEVLDLVPANVAEEFFLIPIYIRHTKGGERALYVAMNDPSDGDALKFVAATAGMPVKPMVAGPSDIATAIRYYYYGEDIVPEHQEQPAPGRRHSSLPPLPPVSDEDNRAPLPPLRPLPEAAVAAPPPPPPAVDRKQETDEIVQLDQEELRDADSQSPEAATTAKETPPPEVPLREKTDAELFTDKMAAQREAERRLYGVGKPKARGGFALTLLDGTQISFGGTKSEEEKKTGAGKLTKEDLLAGLRAAAGGTPLDDFLPAEKWESYVAAMLKVLFNKHLIFFDEFMKELEQIEKKDT